MAVIKFDVSNSDPKKALSGGGQQPKPGTYKVKIIQCKLGHQRDNEDNKRLEIIAEVLDKAYKGARLYDYIGFDEAQEWKMDQFLQVLGIANPKKRKGQFKTEDVVGTLTKIRVKGDTYQGEYKAKLAAWLLDEDEDVDDEDLEDDELEDDELEEGDEEDEEADDEDEEAEEDEDEEGGDYTYEDLAEMDLAELKALAEENEVDLGRAKKKESILAKLAEEWGLEPSEEEEDEDEDDDEEPF